MWPTLDGMRALKQEEATLVCEATRLIVDRIERELEEETETHASGIDWFDQWDVEQRAWLIEEVVDCLLTDRAPPSPAAIWEATIDAILCQVVESIIDETEVLSSESVGGPWRQSVIDAFRCQRGRGPSIDVGEVEIDRWRGVVTQIFDMILGVTCYQQAESFRDGEFARARQFLQEKGMPEDYLERIPPLRTVAQAEQSIERTRDLIGR